MSEFEIQVFLYNLLTFFSIPPLIFQNLIEISNPQLNSEIAKNSFEDFIHSNPYSFCIQGLLYNSNADELSLILPSNFKLNIQSQAQTNGICLDDLVLCLGILLDNTQKNKEIIISDLGWTQLFQDDPELLLLPDQQQSLRILFKTKFYDSALKTMQLIHQLAEGNYDIVEKVTNQGDTYQLQVPKDLHYLGLFPISVIEEKIKQSKSEQNKNFQQKFVLQDRGNDILTSLNITKPQFYKPSSEKKTMGTLEYLDSTEDLSSTRNGVQVRSNLHNINNGSNSKVQLNSKANNISHHRSHSHQNLHNHVNTFQKSHIQQENAKNQTTLNEYRSSLNFMNPMKDTLKQFQKKQSQQNGGNNAINELNNSIKTDQKPSHRKSSTIYQFSHQNTEQTNNNIINNSHINVISQSQKGRALLVPGARGGIAERRSQLSSSLQDVEELVTPIPKINSRIPQTQTISSFKKNPFIEAIEDNHLQQQYNSPISKSFAQSPAVFKLKYNKNTSQYNQSNTNNNNATAATTPAVKVLRFDDKYVQSSSSRRNANESTSLHKRDFINHSTEQQPQQGENFNSLVTKIEQKHHIPHIKISSKRYEQSGKNLREKKRITYGTTTAITSQQSKSMTRSHSNLTFLTSSYAKGKNFAKKVQERASNPSGKKRIWIKLDQLQVLESKGDNHGDIFLAKNAKLKFEVCKVGYEGDLDIQEDRPINDPKNPYIIFTEKLTELQDRLAKYYPYFDKVKQMMKAWGFAYWLIKNEYPIDKAEIQKHIQRQRMKEYKANLNEQLFMEYPTSTSSKRATDFRSSLKNRGSQGNNQTNFYFRDTYTINREDSTTKYFQNSVDESTAANCDQSLLVAIHIDFKHESFKNQFSIMQKDERSVQNNDLGIAKKLFFERQLYDKMKGKSRSQTTDSDNQMTHFLDDFLKVKFPLIPQLCCEVCETMLSFSEMLAPHNNKHYCRIHHPHQCGYCLNIVFTGAVFIQKQAYHRDCLTCKNCGESIGKEKAIYASNYIIHMRCQDTLLNNNNHFEIEDLFEQVTKELGRKSQIFF